MCPERYIKVKLVLVTGAPCVVKCVCVYLSMCAHRRVCVRVCVGVNVWQILVHMEGTQRYPLGCCQSFRRLLSTYQACLELS